MTDLLSELQHATKGSRELDAKILAIKEDRELFYSGDDLMGKSRQAPHDACILYSPKRDYTYVPHYTTNLQDALGLVPEGCAYIIEFWPDTGASADVVRVGDKPSGSVYAKTPALALCIAALKAREGNDLNT